VWVDVDEMSPLNLYRHQRDVVPRTCRIISLKTGFVLHDPCSYYFITKKQCTKRISNYLII